jgi:hypothetical protein
VDAHHVRHWAEGGETALENLTLLCSQHHRLLHEGGFRIGRNADGTLYFKRPDGRVIPRFGYRLDDVLDEGAEDGAVDDHRLVELGLSARSLADHDPSAEVRSGQSLAR